MPNKFVVFHIQDRTGRALAGALLTAESNENGPWSATSNKCGDCKTWLAPGHYALTVRHQNLVRVLPVDIGECTADNEGSGEITVGLEASEQPPSEGVAPIVADGSFFRYATGEPMTLRDASSFQSYEKYLRADQSLVQHLSQLRDEGFNTHRVFLMARNLFNLDPFDVPNFYVELQNYVRFAANRFGLRSNLVVFPDCALVMPDLGDQLRHWIEIGRALRPVAGQCLVSLQNEADQAPNKIDAGAFSKLPGLLCSHGSNGSRQPPVRHWWDWEEYHTNETDQWWREPHNGMEFSEGDAEGFIEPSHVPMHISENKRPDRDGVVSHFGDAAECGALLVAGWCFHSIPGRTSDILSGHDLDCARAAMTGMRRIAPQCHAGGYKHRKDLERPDAGLTGERAYQRGDADTCIAHSLKEGA